MEKVDKQYPLFRDSEMHVKVALSDWNHTHQACVSEDVYHLKLE